VVKICFSTFFTAKPAAGNKKHYSKNPTGGGIKETKGCFVGTDASSPQHDKAGFSPQKAFIYQLAR